MAQQVKASLEKHLNGMTAKPGANGTVGEKAKEADNANRDDDHAKGAMKTSLVAGPPDPAVEKLAKEARLAGLKKGRFGGL